MRHTLFIRSYHKDIKWLKYALQSIHKFCTGWDEIVIVVPESQLVFFKDMGLTTEKLLTCPDYTNDYIGQQLTKLEAYRYTDADIITFWDSDVIAFEPITPGDYIVGGKPILYKTNYEELKGDQGYLWKAITERALGDSVEFEYMRRLPLTYHRSTLVSLQIYFKLLHNKTPLQYVEEITDKGFSEFNLVGAYAEKTEPEKYVIMDTSTISLPPVKAKQFWSWSKLTPQEETEIKGLIG